MALVKTLMISGAALTFSPLAVDPILTAMNISDGTALHLAFLLATIPAGVILCVSGAALEWREIPAAQQESATHH